MNCDRTKLKAMDCLRKEPDSRLIDFTCHVCTKNVKKVDVE